MNTASTQHAKKKKKMGKLQKYENYKLIFLAKEFLVMINVSTNSWVFTNNSND